MFDDNIDTPVSGNERVARFWAAHGSGSITTPIVIVDSGHEWSNGPLSYIDIYGTMIDNELARAPEAQITVNSSTLSGDVLTIKFDVTNKSGVVLSYSNAASVAAIVYEEGSTDAASTSTRSVRGFKSKAISSNLANGATSTFELSITINSAEWSKMRPIVWVEYKTSGVYDMLQAARAPIDN